MELTVVKPLNIQMPDGLQKFQPGQRVTLPDDVGQRLLQLAPGKVQRVTDEELAVGQKVLIQIPTQIKSPIDYSWEEFSGHLEVVDRDQHLGLVIPDSGHRSWIWVNLVFIKRLPEEDGAMVKEESKG